jgi:hypothetical protein
MIDQKALKAALEAFMGVSIDNTAPTELLSYMARAITTYEAAKPQLDQEALEIVLDYAGKGHGYTVKERQTAIAKLRGTE